MSSDARILEEDECHQPIGDSDNPEVLINNEDDPAKDYFLDN